MGVLIAMRRSIPQAGMKPAMLRFWCIAVISVGLSMMAGQSRAEVSSASEALVKIAFVYNFGKFVEWPPDTADAASTNFFVCTIGDIDQFRQALADIENKNLQGRPVEVREVAGIADFSGCRTLFIAQSEHNHIKEILKAAHARHILTVSDIDGFAERGGIFELLTRGGRVQFNINAQAAHTAGLVISSDLMKLARTVYEQEQN
jgi:hypothetical protein